MLTLIGLGFAFLTLSIRPKYTANYGFGYTTLLLFYCIGYYNGQSHNTALSPDYFGSTDSKQFLVKISDPPVEKDKSVKIVVTVLQNPHQKVSGKLLLYLEKDSGSLHLKYGDLLNINSKTKRIKANGNPHEFDYKRYLKIHNVHHQAYLKKTQWTKTGESSSFIGRILSIRDYLSNKIDHSVINQKNKKIAKALLLGEKEFLDKDILNAFSSAGAMHVLAVSGLHVGIIMLILQFLLKPLLGLKKGRLFYIILILSGVWGYAIITGLSPSVIRAAIMFSFITVGQQLERDTSLYQSILVAAFLILLFDPYSLFKVGFQLSFLAVIGIITLQPKLYKLFYFKRRPIDYIWQITTVSAAAQIATFPLGLYYFHQFPNLFFISNLFVIPFAGILLMTGFLYFILHPITPVAKFLEHALDYMLSGLNYGVETIEKMPYSIVWGISISALETFIIYFIIIFLAITAINKSKRYFFIGLSSIALLLSLLNFRSIKNERTSSLIIYNIKQDFAIDIFKGSKNHFISTTHLLKNQQKLQFHIQHHWFYKKGAALPNKITYYNSLNNPVISFESFTFLVVNQPFESYVPKTDYVILENINFIPDFIMQRWLENQTTVIIHPNLSDRVAGFIEQKIPEKYLYKISQSGAFILQSKRS